jgi:Putative peptidoglycan binding domain
MTKILTCAAITAMLALAWSANGAQQAARPKAPAKKTATKKKASTAHRPAVKTVSARGKKTPVRRGVTWRNRQLSPSPDRYREIQGALAAKGFLTQEQATGAWNQASSDALKKFQADQNLESSGKINSLSLIALGLGPRRDSAPPSPPPQGQ